MGAVTTSQSHDGMRDDEVWGRCNVCRELVIYGDRFTHPCENYYVDYSWNAINNPDNTPWVPGYRFCAMQQSGARTKNFRARTGRMTPRRYRVYFEIDQDGKLKHTGGPKPTDDLVAGLEALYLEKRPGANWYPGADDE